MAETPTAAPSTPGDPDRPAASIGPARLAALVEQAFAILADRWRADPDNIERLLTALGSCFDTASVPEIEMVLVQHPAVRDCAVFGVPDEEYGERIAAAVEFKPGAGASEGELLGYLGRHLAKYKQPTLITVHETLPREDSGKIFKRKLREPYWEQAGRRI